MCCLQIVKSFQKYVPTAIRAFATTGTSRNKGVPLSAAILKIIPFRSIDIFENAVSAGTGNFLVDGPKETVCIDESILPEDTTFGVRISGDSMEPEFHDGQIAWVLQQESVANGEIGIFALNGEAYIKKLQNVTDGIFLISLNEKYAPIKVGENDRLDIFGKVLGKSDASAITGHYR